MHNGNMPPYRVVQKVIVTDDQGTGAPHEGVPETRNRILWEGERLPVAREVDSIIGEKAVINSHIALNRIEPVGDHGDTFTRPSLHFEPTQTVHVQRKVRVGSIGFWLPVKRYKIHKNILNIDQDSDI